MIGLLSVGIIFVGLVANVMSTKFVRTTETVPAMTVSDLTRFADVIVTARVISQSNEVLQPLGDRIPTVLTHTTLSVLSRHKGTPASEIVVTTRGGRNGDVLQVAESEPTFSVGDRVIVFLFMTRDGTYAPVGAYQGAFRVRGDIASNGDLQLAEAKLMDAIARGQ